MRRLLADVSETTLLAVLEADNRASEKFDAARRSVEEYAAAVDAAAAQVAAASAEMDAAGHNFSSGFSNDMGQAGTEVERFSGDLKTAVSDTDQLGSGFTRLGRVIYNTSEEYKTLAHAQEHVDNMLQSNGGLFNEASMRGLGYGWALDMVAQNAAEMSNQVGSTDEGLRKFGNDTEQAGAEVERFTRDLEHAGSEFPRFSGGLAEAEHNLRIFHTAMRDAEGEFPKFAGDMGTVDDSFERFSRNLGNTSANLPDMRRGLVDTEDEFRKFSGILDQSSGRADRFNRSLGSFGPSARRVTGSIDELGRAAERSSGSMGNLSNSTNNAGNAAGGATGRIAMIAGAIAALSGPVEGLLALGIPAFFGLLGAGATALKNHLDQLTASGKKLTAMQQAELAIVTPIAAAWKNVEPVILAAAQAFGKMVQTISGPLNAAFKALGPMITSTMSGFSDFIKILVVGFAPMMTKLQPVVDAFAQGLRVLANALVQMLGSMNFSVAADGLRVLFAAGGQLLILVGQILNALAPLSNAVVEALVPLSKMAGVLVDALAPAFNALIPLIDPVVKLVGALVKAFLPMIKVLVDVISKLAAGLAPIIEKLTPMIAQLASQIGDQLGKELQGLLSALLPLLPPLADLAGAILQALLKVMVALAPSQAKLIDGFVKIVQAVVPLIPQFVTLIQNLTPLIVLLVKMAGIMIGPTVNAIVWVAGKLAWLIGILMDVINFLTSVFTVNWSNVWKSITGFFGRFVQGIKDKIAEFKKIGTEIIDGLIAGVRSKLDALGGVISGIGNWIKNAFKSALSIFSPSRVMADEIGAFIPAGIAKGIIDHMGLVTDAAHQVTSAAVKGAKVGMNATGLNLSAAGMVGGNSAPTSLQVVFQGNQLMSDRDMEIFVSKMGPTLVNVLQRAGVNIRK